MITIGICGLQSHIGVTHHALAMAQALSEQYKYVCYKECNTHDIYDVLQNSSLKKTMPGYIRIMNVDIFNKNADVEEYSDKYKFCIMDFGTINECTQAEFFETDIPIIIAGIKDWEFNNFMGAYSQGILDKANVVINFFPKKEQSDLQNAFSDLKIFFADYAPEVFEPIPNISMYNQIINTSLSEV